MYYFSHIANQIFFICQFVGSSETSRSRRLLPRCRMSLVWRRVCWGSRVGVDYEGELDFVEVSYVKNRVIMELGYMWECELSFIVYM